MIIFLFMVIFLDRNVQLLVANDILLFSYIWLRNESFYGRLY